MGLIPLITVLSEIALKYMESLPDYEQNKRELFYQTKKAYLEEINKEFYDRDDNLVGQYHDQLCIVLEAFHKEISGQKI